jgi:cobalt-zinc-cadmium efflux system membrane fusion protein
MDNRAGRKVKLGAALGIVAAGVLALVLARCGKGPAEPSRRDTPARAEAVVDLSPGQIEAIRMETAGTARFTEEREALGSIDFDENQAVQVYPPYPGTLLEVLVDLGCSVKRDQPIYILRSPDLIQAESTLIAAEGTFALTTKALARARSLQATQGIADKDLEQAVSDQQGAEGALKAARDAVRVFGKTEAEIDRIIATRRIDPALVVRSPLAGKVIARNAQAGLFVQPGTAPAPLAVAQVASKWLIANVTEDDSPLFHVGQTLSATVAALPGRTFPGRIARVGEAVDPATHRVQLRSEISDPRDELRPGMLASFRIQLQGTRTSVAVPENAVVREADGTMTIWTTRDRRRFERRVARTGLRQDGRVQILEGLAPGECVVTDGTIFLANMLNPAAED